MKTHFAEISDGGDGAGYIVYDTITACGLVETESYLTNKIKEVDCKNCLRVLENTKIGHN